MVEFTLIVWAVLGILSYFILAYKTKAYLSFRATILAAVMGPFVIKDLVREVSKKRESDNNVTLISGALFDPFRPAPKLIDIQDIAWSLSMQCRYNGHVKRFYSVAEHSIHVVSLVKAMNPDISYRKQLQALMHDATEAYIGDMVKPVKVMFSLFNKVEDKLWVNICTRFDMDIKWSKELTYCDGQAAVTEMETLTSRKASHTWTEGIAPSPVPLPRLTQKEAYSEFIKLYNYLAEKAEYEEYGEQ
jgi:hypothetical protein